MKRSSIRRLAGAMRRRARSSLGLLVIIGVGGAGLGMASLGVSTSMIGLTTVAAMAQAEADPLLPAGFCAAPGPLTAETGLSDAAAGRPLAAFVSCRELGEWRAGRRDSFDVAGRVILRPASALRQVPASLALDQEDGTRLGEATLAPEAVLASLAGAGDAATVTRIMTLAAEMAASGRSRVDLGTDRADGVLFQATLLRRAPGRLHVRMIALAEPGSGAAATQRELVMPFAGGDTLRYMRAALRAGLAADDITGVAALAPETLLAPEAAFD